MAQRLIAMRVLLLSVALAASNAPAQVQPLSDPMRPSGSPAMGAPDTQPADQAASLQLQSVLLSPQRKLAVINGQTFKLGERVGEAKLVAISETGVVLKRGEESKTLPLVSGIEKSSGKRSARGQKEGAKR